MATVTSSTGAKIGHIANQISFEKLDKIENVVINAGQNCTNDIEKLDKDKWQERTRSEISEMEKQVVNLMNKGKRVFVMAVPPVPATTSTSQRKEGRKYINKNLKKLVQSGITKGAPGTAVFLEENEGNFHPATDFLDERHLTPIAIERVIRKIEEMLPADQKLRNTKLTEHATCKPYKGCYGTYPIGCSFCTQMEHQEHECKVKTGQEKRNHSTDDDSQ